MKLLGARDLAVVDPPAAYRSMMRGGEYKVDWCGPAFFSKWLHFAAYERCEVDHRPLIVDRLVAATLGWGATGWSGSRYLLYLDIAEQVRQRWCPDQPSYVVEYALFNLRATHRRLTSSG
ncbi:MAG: hypothetical protein M3Y49_16390 [Actinomycetota bacterium]|nr:hypothetical protein [Actinomycetota bacterium]